MDLFVENFKLETVEGVAKFLSYNVEASVNALHSAERDQKTYLNKARSLAFNLKKNEVSNVSSSTLSVSLELKYFDSTRFTQRLRKDIVEGRLQSDHLVHLSTSELATDDVREGRDHATKQADLARRGDLYEITRAAILTANGIDPNKGGEFCCRRCKGTKTTHYSLQTRSSDEPMTVFVCCLTCGNRWRCT
jgi:transcription elongation factor S-II